MANQNSTKVVTGIVRLSYANVWEPTSVNGVILPLLRQEVI